jgi:hypothetical protein
MNAYEEVIDWIAAGRSSQELAHYQASTAAKEPVALLLRKEKTEGLLPDEKSELDHYSQLEHIMRLAKVRALQHLSK